MFTVSGEIRLCATPHRRLSLLRVRLSRSHSDYFEPIDCERDTAKFACVRSMEELDVISAGVVAAAWSTPT